MGADLYINEAYESRLKQMKPKLDESLQILNTLTRGTIDYRQEEEKYLNLLYELHDGVYFRDSYNCTSIAWSLRLSWWDDVYPMLDKENKLSKNKTYGLIKMIKLKNLHISDDLLEHLLTKEEAKNFLENKRKELLSFLSKSIDSNQEIYCSL
jgi:hypothetical protein